MEKKKVREEKNFNYKTMIIVFVIFSLLSAMNMCNSCKSNATSKKNEKAITALDSSIVIVNENLVKVQKEIATVPSILQENDDWQTAKFLYWERKADGSSFANYTPKDYYDLIKKDK